MVGDVRAGTVTPRIALALLIGDAWLVTLALLAAIGAVVAASER